MFLSPLIRFLAVIPLISLLSGCATSHRSIESGGDIHQIGLVWLKTAGNSMDQQKIFDAVHSFERDIPEVKSATVGRSDGIGGPFSVTDYDICFILSFANEADRLWYNTHPVHEKAAQEVFLPLATKLIFYRFVDE